MAAARRLSQVASRIILLWSVVVVSPPSSTEHLRLAPMLMAWAVTEVIRYSFYAFNLLGTVRREAGGSGGSSGSALLRVLCRCVLLQDHNPCRGSVGRSPVHSVGDQNYFAWIGADSDRVAALHPVFRALPARSLLRAFDDV